MHGGARTGSGRKPGVVTTRSRQAAEAAAASGLTPLDYMLSIMRDIAVDDARRLDAAKSAAPYVHARLSNVEAKVEGALEHVHRVQLVGPDDETGEDTA